MSVRLLPGKYALPPPYTLLFQLLVSSAAISFMPTRSLARLATLPLVATCVYSVVSTASSYMRPSWATIIGCFSFAFLLQYIDLAFLSQWSLEHHSLDVQVPHSSTDSRFESDEAVFTTPQESLNGDAAARKDDNSQEATFLDRLRFG